MNISYHDLQLHCVQGSVGVTDNRQMSSSISLKQSSILTSHFNSELFVSLF